MADGNSLRNLVLVIPTMAELKGGAHALQEVLKTIDEVEVTFEIGRPDADKVERVAETTDWSPIEMKRANRGEGPWRLTVRLPKDRPVQFRYGFDEAVWDNDEAADAYWPNDKGSDNSVGITG